jgi:hypothetical protein
MTDASVTVNRLLHTPGPQFDDLFRRSPSDRIPSGAGDGTVISAPDSPVALLTAGLVRLLAWKGKTFDPGTGSLPNRMATVLLRHCPELAPALRSAVNVFSLWPRTGPFTQEDK